MGNAGTKLHIDDCSKRQEEDAGKDLQEEGCRKRIAARRPQEKCSRKRTNSGLQEDVLQNCRNEVAQSRLQEEAYI